MKFRNSENDNFFLPSGTLTTTTSLHCLIAVLVNKPEIQQKMADAIAKEIGTEEPRLRHRERLAYIEAAILELLRYSSILPLDLPHCTMTDVVINGYDIPKDTMVSQNINTRNVMLLKGNS